VPGAVERDCVNGRLFIVAKLLRAQAGNKEKLKSEKRETGLMMITCGVKGREGVA